MKLPSLAWFINEKYFPTWVTAPDSAWVKAAEAAYEQTLDRVPKVDKWTFSTNGVAISGMHSIPASAWDLAMKYMPMLPMKLLQ
jgi:hypothetical protein